MTKANEQTKALSLRRSGQSINEISKILHVSKSTVSGWCKDISLTEKQLKNIADKSRHRATLSLLKASEAQRAQRIKNIQFATTQGKNEVGTLTNRDIHMVGLGLYWGEGYKKGSQELGFTNSDPFMIQFYIEWLEKVYAIKKSELILRVSINNLHAHRLEKILAYWSKITNIPTSQFTKTSLIKTSSKKIYKNLDEHFGTLRVKVRRGTDLRRKILGSIQALTIK